MRSRGGGESVMPLMTKEQHSLTFFKSSGGELRHACDEIV